MLHRRTWSSGEGEGAPLIGLFWAGIWLFWLLSPLVTSLRRLDRPSGWIGSIAIVVFAALYLWHWTTRWQIFEGKTCSSARQGRDSLLRYAGMLVLSFPPVSTCRGNGLLGLRERALVAGAEVVTSSIEPHGFAITMDVAHPVLPEMGREKAHTS